MSVGYITTEEFENLTGITNRNAAQLQLAIESAAQEMRRILYVKKDEQFSAQRTTFQMGKKYFADYDLDGSVTKADIQAWEIVTTNGVLVWTALTPSTDITSIDEEAAQVTFTTTRPTSGKTLLVRYYWTRFKCADMLSDLKVLNKLMAQEECYKMMMSQQLQNGISAWSLDGVSISFDVAAVTALIASNREEIKRKIQLLKPFYVVPTKDIGEYDLADKLRTPRYI